MGIENDADRFRVPSFPGVDIFVSGMGGMSAFIADFSFNHPWDFSQNFLHAPKTSSGKIDSFKRFFF